jgi:hypothetical protein
MSSAVGDDPHEVTTSSVLRRDVPWETYLTARLISEPDLQLIRSYDKRGRATQEDLLAEARCLPLRGQAEVARSCPACGLGLAALARSAPAQALCLGVVDSTDVGYGLEPAWRVLY